MNTKTNTITLRVPDLLKKNLDLVALENNLTLSNQIRIILESFIANECTGTLIKYGDIEVLRYEIDLND